MAEFTTILDRLEVTMRLGIHPHEAVPQRVRLSVWMTVDYAAPPAADRIDEVLDYDFSRHVQQLADETSRELGAGDIWDRFEATYLPRQGDRFVLRDYEETGSVGDRRFVGRVAVDGEERSISGRGNGLISGVIAALADTTGPTLDVIDYSEHAIGHGADAQAVAYVECRTGDGRTVFGVGMDTDIATASVRAVLSAANQVDMSKSGLTNLRPAVPGSAS